MSDCFKILHTGAIEEYVCSVNMACMVKLVQLRVSMAK